MNNSNRVFFGYPSQPGILRDTVAEASRLIGETGLTEVETWETLKTGGQIIISKICEAIDRASLSCFDLTKLNQNVMFEVGYAIGANRPIWLTRDTTDERSSQIWKQVRLLTPVGYISYQNAQDIRQRFIQDQPHVDTPTIFEKEIEPNLVAGREVDVFYLKGVIETEPSRRLTQRIRRYESRGFRLSVDDATESNIQPLHWYGQQIYQANSVLAHFCGQHRTGASVHNARAALICGLAFGMNKPLLMLAEEEYPAPLDYGHLLFIYRHTRECVDQADSWLSERETENKARQAGKTTALRTQHLATELRSLRLGEHVAENEEAELTNYFVETANYSEVLTRQLAVFVGRKGTGKTANLIRAASELKKDKRNVVCVIKPAGYEMDSLVALLQRFRGFDTKSYLVESMWKFLIYSELGAVALQAIRDREQVTHVSPIGDERELTKYMEDPGNGLNEEFSVRLEHAVTRLADVAPESSIGSTRMKISESLHSTVLSTLRRLLGNVLTDKERVAILIDNLDKSWKKGVETEVLSELILGLISSIGRIQDDFRTSTRGRRPVRFTAAIFIRSDIFSYVSRAASEPDKIPFSHINWNDKDLLLRVIEERYIAARQFSVSPEQLWEELFCPTINGQETRDYIFSSVLSRPRDIVYLCNAAIVNAVNRGHPLVEEKDVIDAREYYSQFALEALLVENGISIPEIENILYEFAGGTATRTEEDVQTAVRASGISEERRDEILRHLLRVSFLGREKKPGVFQYSEEVGGWRADVGQRLCAGQTPRYSIHPAFRPYLEVE